MSAYSELIKSFERIRAYMREFYVYGFKSRDEYSAKSARSYDDERRRMESWLGDMARQGLFLIPMLLILPPLLGLTGIQTAQPIADALTFVLAFFVVRNVLRELSRMPDKA